MKDLCSCNILLFCFAHEEVQINNLERKLQLSVFVLFLFDKKKKKYCAKCIKYMHRKHCYIQLNNAYFKIVSVTT